MIINGDEQSCQQFLNRRLYVGYFSVHFLVLQFRFFLQQDPLQRQRALKYKKIINKIFKLKKLTL